MTGDGGAAIFHTSELPWEEFSGSPQLPARMRTGVRRQQLAEGRGGFFAHVAEMDPGYRVEPHSHSHSEFFLVLAGSCELDGGEKLGPGDSAVFDAHQTYGFTCLDEGLRFCVVRTERAEMKIDQ